MKSNIKRNAEARARRVIGNSGCRLKLALGVIICIAVTFVLWNLSDSVGLLVSLLVENQAVALIASTALMYLLVVFLAAPVYIGLYFMATKMIRGENAVLIDIFECFESARSYGRSIRLSIGLLLRLLPIVVMVRAPYALYSASEFWELPDFIFEGGQLVFMLAALVFVLPAAAGFGFVTFSELCRGDSVGSAVKMARKARKGKYSLVFSLAYTTLLRLVLSLLTIGLITVLHTIPMSLLRYASLAYEFDNR